MSQLRVAALLALAVLALPLAPVSAQAIFGPGIRGNADISTPGRVTDQDVAMCQAGPGGSRVRENCEVETTTLRLEHEIKFSVELPAIETRQCAATTTTEYEQLNAIARVDGTLEIRDCTAAYGSFKVALRTKDDGGEDSLLEFNETWERGDKQDVRFTGNYPIGENVELMSARIRELRCICVDGATGDAEVPEVAATPEQPSAEQ
jgi:hypothetical protein